MQSSNYDYSQNLKSLIAQYEEIGKLTSGQKLAIDKSSGKLVRSFGSTQGMFSKTFQSISRTMGSYSGYYNTDFKEVMSKMSQINHDFQSCLSHIPQNELKLQQIKHFKSVLNHAVESLAIIKNTSYPGSVEAQKNIEDQIDSIRKLVKDLETFKSVPEEASDEEDWMLVQNKSTSSTSQTLGEEEFEFVQEKGEKFEKKISSFVDLIQDPKKLEENPDLTLSPSVESIFEPSSLVDQDWEIIQKPLEVGEAFIAKISHPSFDNKRALDLFKELIKNAPDAQISPKIDKNWLSVSAALDLVESKIKGLDAQQHVVLRSLITDLVTGVLFPICDTTGNQRQLMPLNHLVDVLHLISDDPVKFISDRKWILDDLAKNPPYQQRIHLLFLFNFTNPDLIRQFFNNPTFRAINSSPHLEKLIINSNTHVPQIYRQTCRGTVHNLLYQQHCGTISEMLALSHTLSDQISDRLSKASRDDLDAPAFKTSYGKAITKEMFANRVLDGTKEKIQILEQKAVALAGSKICTAEQVEALTREWNFIMQDLETIQDPLHPRIYDKQFIPNMYYVSAALNVVTTWVSQLMPGQPLVAERWVSLDNEKLYEIGKASFGLPQRSYLYRQASEELNPANTPTNLTPLQIWEELDRRGGGILEFFYLGGNIGSSGHAMFVKASLAYGDPVVELWDPMSSSKRRFSIEGFKEFLVENYDARKGKVAILNHLAFY